MNVRELIEQLQQVQDKEIDVLFYGDGKPAEIVGEVDLKTANQNGFCPLLPMEKPKPPAGTKCGARAPGGVSCTKLSGHPGNHQAGFFNW
jgi:hypothetical protein